MYESDARAIYDEIAEKYSTTVDVSAYNAHYERPAMLSLIEAAQKDVLDVGCGNGFYLEQALLAGATGAVGIDYSSKMVEYARRRLGDKATVYLADLRKPLDVLGEARFDLVVCPLVLHYIEDWETSLRLLHSRLKDDGALVLSVGHPFADMPSSVSQNYFDVELIHESWPSFGVVMPTYRRSLTSMFAAFAASGFVVETLLEPQPDEFLERENPKLSRDLRGTPNFLCLRLRKRSGSRFP